MTEEQIAFALTEQFLPQFTLCNPDQNSQTPAHAEQIPQYTQAAMTIFDDPIAPDHDMGIFFGLQSPGLRRNDPAPQSPLPASIRLNSLSIQPEPS